VEFYETGSFDSFKDGAGNRATQRELVETPAGPTQWWPF
jgi:hypothetical protein